MFTMRAIFISLFTAVLLVGLPAATYAAMVRSEDIVTIREDEIIDDNLIVFADAVDISGTIQGDLIVATDIANIKGTVEGDIIGVARSITIGGEVKGDIRVAAENLVILDTVGGNVTAVAENLTLGETSEIGHSVMAATGLFTADGAIVKHINVAAGNMQLNGPVGGNVNVALDTEGKLLLKEHSRIGGDISYSAAKELDRLSGAEVAGIIRKIDVSNIEFDIPFKEIFFAIQFYSFLAIMVVGLFIINLFPKQARGISDTLLAEPIKLPFLGFAYFIATPIILLLGFFTLIGIPLVLILFLIYVITIYLAKVFAGLALGRLLIGKATEHEVSLFFSLISGILLIYIITSIPILGWAVGLLFTWWGLAGIMQWCYTQYRANR